MRSVVRRRCSKGISINSLWRHVKLFQRRILETSRYMYRQERAPHIMKIRIWWNVYPDDPDLMECVPWRYGSDGMCVLKNRIWWNVCPEDPDLMECVSWRSGSDGMCALKIRIWRNVSCKSGSKVFVLQMWIWWPVQQDIQICFIVPKPLKRQQRESASAAIRKQGSTGLYSHSKQKIRTVVVKVEQYIAHFLMPLMNSRTIIELMVNTLIECASPIHRVKNEGFDSCEKKTKSTFLTK